MKINRLDHVNLRTNQLDTMIAWYEDVLGLHNGARPDFGFPGAWLYAGDAAVVHISQVEDDAGTGSEAALKLEHFALTASGGAAFEERLNTHGVMFKKASIAALGVTAFNIWDPDGNHIHVDFTDAG